MKTIQLSTTYRKLLADTVTPVSVYLKLRDKFRNCIMLESSDYHGNENSFSYICFEPLASFELDKGTLRVELPGEETTLETLADRHDAVGRLNDFAATFKNPELPFKFLPNGLFGYMSYDAVESFEDIDLSENDEFQYHIPEIVYRTYRFVIVVDHFKNELYLFEHHPEGEKPTGKLEEIVSLINNRNLPVYGFKRDGEEVSNFTDDEYMEIVEKGREHCMRGDVFQIVLSRRFSNTFKGDEFNVYRALRSVNPSPYLFYFDYGNYKLFGSSPEAQIVIKDDEATIYPIAGTFRRTGNDEADAELAKKLYDDPKENSEHVMLVDLARNDLSRNGDNVTVETFKEIQYYSHVIHLVSKVTGRLGKNTSAIRMVADTFPAGTLSGAPKHMAMTLINRYETLRRGYYGGAIGYCGFDGTFNHAIMIRSFCSTGNRLYYQAGAGVVAKSRAESEKQEVYNKLAALHTALELAEEIRD
ncbi:anthranilate synthase component I family protein [Roseivirga sp. BDSF3-8]|uniref:anthranilate synthase component I family protein n=1 Tax=Roseivirga sp. BDSF3-8 TaxID=3241598 RepID=UPI0035323C45